MELFFNKHKVTKQFHLLILLDGNVADGGMYPTKAKLMKRVAEFGYDGAKVRNWKDRKKYGIGLTKKGSK